MNMKKTPPRPVRRRLVRGKIVLRPSNFQVDTDSDVDRSRPSCRNLGFMRITARPVAGRTAARRTRIRGMTFDEGERRSFANVHTPLLGEI